MKIKLILTLVGLFVLSACSGVNRFAIQGPNGDTVGTLNSVSDSTDIFTPATKTQVLVTQESCGDGQTCTKSAMSTASGSSPVAQIINPAATVGSAAILGYSFPKPAGQSVVVNGAAAAAAAAAASSSASGFLPCVSC